MSFQKEWVQLGNDVQRGHFDFDSSALLFSQTVDKHFAHMSAARYGVYLVRRVSTNEVIYIGRGGCISASGQFKDQDVPGRLKAPRRDKNTKRDIPANRWFDGLRTAEGALKIEYVLLGKAPISPGLAEAKLLQAFLDDHGVLPRYNNMF